VIEYAARETFIADPFIAEHPAGECVGEAEGEGEGEALGPGTMPPLVLHAGRPPAMRLASAIAQNGPVNGFMAQKGYYRAHRG
jgi:hypothetical protein